MSRRAVLGVLGASPLTLGALLGACGGSGNAPSSTASVLEPGGALDKYLDQVVRQNQFSGVALVGKGDAPTIVKAHGMAIVDQKVPNVSDTIFAVGSVAKTFTATAVCQLAQQGKLDFQDTLGRYLSGFSLDASRATIHQLLTHTAGMGDYIGSPMFRSQMKSWTSGAAYMAGLLDVLRQAPLVKPPGQQYMYSNSGYATLGEIVQQVSGQLYYDYVREKVFQPAGMRDTDFFTRPQTTQSTRFAHPYTVSPTDGSLVDGSPMVSFIGTPAGDAYSTVADMLRFTRSLQDGQLLSPRLWQTMAAGKVNGTGRNGHPGDRYAYGIVDSRVNGKRIVWHDGGTTYGIGAQFEIYPTLGAAVVYLINRPGRAIGPIAAREQQLVTSGT